MKYSIIIFLILFFATFKKIIFGHGNTTNS